MFKFARKRASTQEAVEAVTVEALACEVGAGSAVVADVQQPEAAEASPPPVTRTQDDIYETWVEREAITQGVQSRTADYIEGANF
jgi:hypothetical protein